MRLLCKYKDILSRPTRVSGRVLLSQETLEKKRDIQVHLSWLFNGTGPLCQQHIREPRSPNLPQVLCSSCISYRATETDVLPTVLRTRQCWAQPSKDSLGIDFVHGAIWDTGFQR